MGSSAFLLPMEARGVYREMLTQAWRRGARLPNDHEAIQRAIGATRQEWKRCWPKVEKYWRVDGDTLVCDTQLEVYKEAQGVAIRASERGLRGAQARAQARAQAPTQVTPECKPPNSVSVSDTLPERSPGERPRARTTSGVMAGMLPRDHLNCRPPCIRVCLSQRQHVILRARHGGDETSADQALDAFYREVRAQLPDDQPIGDRPWEFWDKQFAALFGTPTVSNKTAGNRAAVERFIARGKS